MAAITSVCVCVCVFPRLESGFHKNFSRILIQCANFTGMRTNNKAYSFSIASGSPSSITITSQFFLRRWYWSELTAHAQPRKVCGRGMTERCGQWSPLAPHGTKHTSFDKGPVPYINAKFKGKQVADLLHFYLYVPAAVPCQYSSKRVPERRRSSSL